MKSNRVVRESIERIPEMQVKNLVIQRGSRNSIMTWHLGPREDVEWPCLKPAPLQTKAQAQLRWAVERSPAQALCAGTFPPAFEHPHPVYPTAKLRERQASAPFYRWRP